MLYVVIICYKFLHLFLSVCIIAHVKQFFLYHNQIGWLKYR